VTTVLEAASCDQTWIDHRRISEGSSRRKRHHVRTRLCDVPKYARRAANGRSGVMGKGSSSLGPVRAGFPVEVLSAFCDLLFSFVGPKFCHRLSPDLLPDSVALEGGLAGACLMLSGI
jgi:hypothetical protein